jgi:hypothetical protein
VSTLKDLSWLWLSRAVEKNGISDHYDPSTVFFVFFVIVSRVGCQKSLLGSVASKRQRHLKKSIKNMILERKF